MENDPQVLIIGAGSTGLTLACQLVRFGVPFRIIDTKTEPTKQSRALVIHARTLEIFDHMGIADSFLEQGIPAKSTTYVLSGRQKKHVSLVKLGVGLTKFPYILILEQFKTGSILVKYLIGDSIV